jgi:hypothetical protein
MFNSTTTSITPLQPTPEYIGYIALFVCVVLFGNNTLPIKKYETGLLFSIFTFYESIFSF